MDTKTFYEKLRAEDRERVRLVVDELKAGGFEVYATGSSLERSTYNDIDLVAKPKEGTTESDAKAGLDAIVENLRVKGGNESKDFNMLFQNRCLIHIDMLSLMLLLDILWVL